MPGDDLRDPRGTKRTIYGHFKTYIPQTGGEIIPAADCARSPKPEYAFRS